MGSLDRDRPALVWAASLLASMRISKSWSPGVGAYRVTCNFCGEDGGHWDQCRVPAAAEWLVRYGRDMAGDGLLDDAGDIIGWLASHGTEESTGDCFYVTCRVCGHETGGRDIKRRDGERHDTGCPIPELRAWAAEHGRG